MVDDSAAIRKILQRVLKQAGVPTRNVLEAADGQEALDLIKTHRVDLILTDINMPRMGGIQLLTTIKSTDQWHRIPVLMITTEGGSSIVSEALRLGAAGYVRKPFSAEQIKEKLVGVLTPPEFS